jgi:hypothetical protein
MAHTPDEILIFLPPALRSAARSGDRILQHRQENKIFSFVNPEAYYRDHTTAA